MNEFGLWFSTGLEHISDFGAYDHILFITLLVLAYPFNEWRRLIILISAFTLGHSLSLVLSILNRLSLPSSAIELLIALSILITGVFQLFNSNNHKLHSGKIIYLIVVLFGLIHGLGFSFLLKAMLGKEQSAFLPLMYFNIGLEVGQLIIVAIVLVFSLLITTFFKWSHKNYKLILLCLITLIALKLSVERFLVLFS